METQLIPDSYVCQIFLVEKKDGGQRPVINLKSLNQFVRIEHFKMEGLHLLPDLLQLRNWMAMMYLKDLYVPSDTYQSQPAAPLVIPVGGRLESIMPAYF